MNIIVDDILPFTFFQYGKPYTGSLKGMHFKIAREPLENTFFNKDPHKDDGAFLRVTLWRGPYSCEATTEEKTVKDFEYSDEGRTAVINWLDECYGEKPEFWAEGMKLK